MNAPLSNLLGAALGAPETSRPAPDGQKCANCRGAFSGMSWDTLCPSCWEEKIRKDSAARRAAAPAAGDPLPTIKGAAITGGYVVVTTRGWDADRSVKVRDAILRLFPVDPTYTPKPEADAAASQQQEG
ncbi:hypothetical protein ABE485_06135 [Achromobacter spanius]|uniref:hypothetical protein n=1 Tax=Achromobacter spanius TaxID=217203 RepID=UPI00320B7D2C